MTWVDALKQEITEKKTELLGVQALIDKSKALIEEVRRLEMILVQVEAPVKTKVGRPKEGKRAARTFSPEQKASQAARMKEYWANKKKEA